MQNNAQRLALGMAELTKLVYDSVEYFSGHPSGLRLPAVITEVVDVAVAAVEVAAARRLNQDSVNFPAQSGTLTVVAIVLAVVRRRGRNRVAGADLIDHPLDGDAVYF